MSEPTAANGRVLAFDWGERRIGWAVSDPSRLIAEAGGHVERSGESVPWRAILALVEEWTPSDLVVGDPLSMSGEPGRSSGQARAFAAELSRRASLPHEMQDERLSSVEAERILVERHGARARPSGAAEARKRKADVDRVAASLILQTWLDRRRARERSRRPEGGA
jgi:putative Holliday junction resolvase